MHITHGLRRCHYLSPTDNDVGTQHNDGVLFWTNETNLFRCRIVVLIISNPCMSYVILAGKFSGVPILTFISTRGRSHLLLEILTIFTWEVGVNCNRAFEYVHSKVHLIKRWVIKIPGMSQIFTQWHIFRFRSTSEQLKRRTIVKLSCERL